jgi:hypothetical protein
LGRFVGVERTGRAVLGCAVATIRHFGQPLNRFSGAPDGFWPIASGGGGGTPGNPEQNE